MLKINYIAINNIALFKYTHKQANNQVKFYYGLSETWNTFDKYTMLNNYLINIYFPTNYGILTILLMWRRNFADAKLV